MFAHVGTIYGHHSLRRVTSGWLGSEAHYGIHVYERTIWNSRLLLGFRPFRELLVLCQKGCVVQHRVRQPPTRRCYARPTLSVLRWPLRGGGRVLSKDARRRGDDAHALP